MRIAIPEVDISNDAIIPSVVEAYMFFPNDENMREIYILHSQLEELTKSKDTKVVEVEIEALKKLSFGSSSIEMESLINKADKMGSIAGYILASIFLMKRYNYDVEPSIKKAVHAVQNTALKFADGSDLYSSEKKIRQCWKEFKSAAHLWAAYCINNNIYEFVPAKTIFDSPEHLMTFLRVSAGLRNFGIEFIPKRSRPEEPILNVPCVPIPEEATKPSYVFSEHPPSDLFKSLAGYTAPETSH